MKMKFIDRQNSIDIRNIAIILFFISSEVLSANSKIKTVQYENEEIQDQLRIGDTDSNPSFRFSTTEGDPNATTEVRNDIMMNSLILNNKPPSGAEDTETEVKPAQATAGTTFKWGYLFWNFMEYTASNALSGHSGFWQSENNVKSDHWEAIFNSPQKLDVISIKWKHPPKRFKIYFKFDDSIDWIPATDTYEKSSYVTNEGKKSAQDAVSYTNVVIFGTPIIAKRLRITLSEPLKKGNFAITEVRFYEKKSTVIIKNEMFEPCKNFCFYVNSDKPKENMLIESYPCIEAIAQGNNNELFVQNTDRSIRHLNSKLCIGFNKAQELVLKKCDDFGSAYTIETRGDMTLFFDGYSDKCISIDDKVRLSPNFVNEETEVIATSEADKSNFKKENIRNDGENYWQSALGEDTVTIQILFGKLKDNTYERKKVDLIKIEWVREPEKFMLYTWSPGETWQLRQRYTNYNVKVSEINLVGIEASGIMLILEASRKHEDLGGLPSYAMKSIYVGYNAMKLKLIECKATADKYKIFDFDPQRYKKNEKTKPALDAQKTVSQTYEKAVATYKNLQRNELYILKAKEQAAYFEKEFSDSEKIENDAIQQLMKYSSKSLIHFQDTMFETFLRTKKEDIFSSGITKSNTLSFQLGTKQYPGEDCLQIKKATTHALSGFYYIKPECSPKPLRVFCDFVSYEDAVDIFIFDDDAYTPNPDLSYLGIRDHMDVRYQCAKLGLFAIQLYNKDMVTRIHQLLIAQGWDLARPVTVPLGYDYTCKSGKCEGLINSITDINSSPIMEFFDMRNKLGTVSQGGSMAGLGYSEKPTLSFFEPEKTIITALICSTNHFVTDSNDTAVKMISCSMNVARNGDIFKEGSDILVKCPVLCGNDIGVVYGNGLYQEKSSVCGAALHSGVMQPRGGKVYVRVQRGVPFYQGILANGIKSLDYRVNDGGRGFILHKYEPKCPISRFADKVENSEEKMFSFIENSVETQDNMARLADIKQLEGIDPEDLAQAGITLKQVNPYDRLFDEYNRHGQGEMQKEAQDHRFFDIGGRGSLTPNLSSARKGIEFGINLMTPKTDKEREILNEVQKGIEDNLGTFSNGFGLARSAIGGLGDRFSTNPIGRASNYISEALDGRLNPLTLQSTGFDNSEDALDQFTQGGAANKNNLISTPKSPETLSLINRKFGIGKRDESDVLPSSIPPVPSGPPPEGPNAERPWHIIEPEAGHEDSRGPVLNTRCTPTTEDSKKILKSIRQTGSYDSLEQMQIKSKKICQGITAFQKKLAWSDKTSKLSNDNIMHRLNSLSGKKTKLFSTIRKLSAMAKSRVQRTERLADKWERELDALLRVDPFKLDYSMETEKLFSKTLTILDLKDAIPSNWDVHRSGIKERSQAIGNTAKIQSKLHLAASIISVQTAQYFDFTLTIDIMLRSSGTAGVIFRMLDSFNYYALVINKDDGFKAIAKSVNGQVEYLTMINDGGIVLNEWHSVIITAAVGQLKAHIYNKEQLDKSSSEKVLQVTDHTFVRGGAGVFVNNVEGFFFDNFSINADTCWTPWLPINELKMVNINSSVHSEDFRGTLEKKFLIIDPSEEREGPSMWMMNGDQKMNKKIGIFQNSLIFDNSYFKRPSMLVYKNKSFTNGSFTVSFIPLNGDGTISVIFKYSKEENKTGQNMESFYTFDLTNDRNNGQFSLRKYQDGAMKELAKISSASGVKGLKQIGYKPKSKASVNVLCINEVITINVSIDNSGMVNVLNYEDSSLNSGSVGVGVYRVKAEFTLIEIMPPKLSLTEADKKYILTNDLDYIPMPDAISVKEASKELSRNPQKNPFQNAYSVVNGQSNLIGSALGKVLTSLVSTEKLPQTSSLSSSSSGTSSSPEFEEGKEEKLTQLPASASKVASMKKSWKVCRSSQTTERRAYCNKIPSEFQREQCNNDFCQFCCEGSIPAEKKNLMHLCKKTCNKAMLAETDNDDYVSVCFNTQSPSQSIYTYCEKKMNDYDKTVMNYCKLDMCNLCCSTMDPIKQKNYSFINVKKCFEKCSATYNVSRVTAGKI